MIFNFFIQEVCNMTKVANLPDKCERCEAKRDETTAPGNDGITPVQNSEDIFVQS